MMITTHEINRQEDIEVVAGVLRERREADADVTRDVAEILDAVESGGDAALVELTWRLDGVRLEGGSLESSTESREEALRGLDASARDALEEAAARIKAFAEKGLKSDWSYSPAPGVTVGTVGRPLETVGLYIPGGRYPYPSTVLMTGFPARAAGVRNLVLCTPPGSDGSVHPATLAAAAMLGDCRVFKVGGAQAIAAMAYGTESVPRCDMIAGPGNVYVATAKRLVRDRVTVDLEAGPSEVVIYADACAVPAYAAADLLAQLEHDPLALAVVVSEDMAVLESVRDALGRQDAAPDGDVNMVLSSERALSIALVNAIAPEHLELMVEDAATMLPEVRSAGCVFLGPYSAVAMGDYIAGPSHVLPTGGTASRLSGLRAADFIRTMNVVSYTREGLEGDAAVARALASLEGLSSHARSVEIRNPGPATELEV